MRSSFLCTLSLVAVIALPLRGEDPGCLLVHPTVPSTLYTGSAAPGGAAGGVLDRCSQFTAPTPWGLTGADGRPFDAIWYNEAQQGLGFWIGSPIDLTLTFWLAGQQVGAFDLHSPENGWWSWDGAYDRVDASGIYFLLLYGQGGVAPDEDLPEDDLGVGGGAAAGFVDMADLDPQATVPEPATLTLLGSGMIGLAAARRRRRLIESSAAPID